MVVADERLKTLLDAFVSVADGLNLDDTLRRVVAAAVSLVDARYGALGVIGEDGGLSSFIHVGIDPTLADEIGPLPTGRGLLGQLISDPHPLRMPDLHSHPQSVGFPTGHPEMTSFLGVPIRVRGGVFGNLYLTDKRQGQFTDEDEQLTVALAAAAGVAIQNSHLFDRNQRRQRWQRAINAVNALVLLDAADTAVLAEAARRLRVLTGAQVSRVEVLDEDGEFGVLGEEATASTGSTAAAEAFGAEGFGAEVPSLVLALRAGERTLGRITLWRAAADRPFNTDERELSEVLAEQTALALSYAMERRERERLAVYEERDRIARDLHDLVIQRIFAAGMMLEGVRRTGELPPPAAARLERAVDELDATVKEIRATIFGLNSSTEVVQGLRDRVSAEVDRAAEGTSTRPSLSFEGPVDTLVPGMIADHVVAVVREGLSNAVRHGGDVAIAVTVEVTDDQVSVRISDQGRGLAFGDHQPRASGLANLERRAVEVGGGYELLPGPSGGVVLNWWAPLGH